MLFQMIAISMAISAASPEKATYGKSDRTQIETSILGLMKEKGFSKCVLSPEATAADILLREWRCEGNVLFRLFYEVANPYILKSASVQTQTLTPPYIKVSTAKEIANSLLSLFEKTYGYRCTKAGAKFAEQSYSCAHSNAGARLRAAIPSEEEYSTAEKTKQPPSIWLRTYELIE